MNKEKFKKFFEKAMAETKEYRSYVDENGDIQGEWVDIEQPLIVIRDFDINKENDREFTNFEEAYRYLKSIEYYRIMSASGHILYDNYW